jgi:hypothetical protein
MESKFDISEDSPLVWSRNYAVQRFLYSPMQGLVALVGAKGKHAELEQILEAGLKDNVWKTGQGPNYAKP